ncbi:MAG: DUF2807 domain-containing protein [Muribaculum sp.]|nr:DUF2807 domain-containing protein [Muribaculaceae bacterium]MCM1080596.1 DUF2807 domain-containing protein [Muribaculum sp.]
MKRFISSLILCLTISLAYAENAKLITTDIKFPEGNYKSLCVSTGVKVKYTIVTDKEAQSAQLTIDKRLSDYFVFKINNGQLEISIDNSKLQTPINNHALLNLSALQVNNINTSSGAQVHLTGNIVTKDDNIVLTASSGSGIFLKDFKCPNLTANVSSGSKISSTGIDNASSDFTISSGSSFDCGRITSENIILFVSSGSSANLNELQSNNLKINISSGSRCDIDEATMTTINVNASSASKLDIQGKADKGIFTTSSTSSIKAKKLVCTTATVNASSVSKIEVTAYNSQVFTSSNSSAIVHKPDK